MDIEKRVYEVVGVNALLVGRPDVTVQRSRSADLSVATNVAVSALPAQPVQVALPMPEEVREAFLEIKEAATQLVVTTIEILSPTNKRGDGRQKYEQKRQQVLSSQTHLIEIDLLCEGEPLTMTGAPASSDYRILVSRADTRPLADLYPFGLEDAIPLFSVPLQAEDPEPVVDLQALLNEVYQRSGYDYFIDYHTDPVPPLSEAKLEWMNRLLKQQG